jgi:hypothetical protein
LARAWAAILGAGLASYRQPEAVAARLDEAVRQLGEADLGLYRWAASTQILRRRHEGTMSLPSGMGKVQQPGRLAALLVPLAAGT